MKDFIRILETNAKLVALPEVSDQSGLRLMFDDGGVPIETGEFLHGLLRLQKPEHVLELGLYSGVSTLFMAQAIKENGVGHIDTVEIEPYHINRAIERLKLMGLENYVTAHKFSSLDFPMDKQYDFILSDTEPMIRFQEVVRYYSHLKEGGYIAIHDLHGHLSQNSPINPDHPDMPCYPFGPIPQEMMQWLKEDKLRVMPFPDTRGLILLYKTKEGDFKI